MKNEEWPKVGDEVIINIMDIEPDSRIAEFEGLEVKIIALTDKEGGKVVTFTHEIKGIGAAMFGDWIKRPPTPVDELTELIRVHRGGGFASVGDRRMAEAIISGEIEGVEYKP